MSKVPLDPVGPDNTDPGCNMERERKYISNKRCNADAETMFYLPNLGIYVFVCKRHFDTVTDLHPDAKEVGL